MLRIADRQRYSRPSIEDRWEERRLFFWTIRQVLAIIALTALTVYFIVTLIEGRLPDELLLRYGLRWILDPGALGSP